MSKSPTPDLGNFVPYKKTILQQHQDYLLSKAKTDVANGPTGELKPRSVSPLVQNDPKRINRVFGGDKSNSTPDNKEVITQILNKKQEKL